MNLNFTYHTRRGAPHISQIIIYIPTSKDHNGGAECYLGEIPIAYYDGEFKAVPKGIHCAIARLIGENIEIETKSRIEKYYSKFGKDSPFKETGKSLIDADIIRFMSRKQIAGILEGKEGIWYGV